MIMPSASERNRAVASATAPVRSICTVVLTCGFERFVVVSRIVVVHIVSQHSSGAGREPRRHDQRENGGLRWSIDAQSTVTEIARIGRISFIYVFFVFPDVQVLGFLTSGIYELREQYRFRLIDVGGDDHDFVFHGAVVLIRLHLANVHGGSAAQVHGLCELRCWGVGSSRIVSVSDLDRRRHAAITRDGQTIIIIIGAGFSVGTESVTATETGVGRLSSLRSDFRRLGLRRFGQRRYDYRIGPGIHHPLIMSN